MISYFIADTHFGHKNIVLGTSTWEDKTACRNFQTVQEHDEFILNNINNKVNANDRLYILGDFSFGGKELIPFYRHKINCKNVILIRGNHDLHMFKNSIVFDNFDKKYKNVNTLFTNVYDLLDFKIGKNKLFLCHYPVYSWHHLGSGAIHLYGHVHKELNYNKNALCVSAECINFMPVSLDYIKKQII